MDSKSYSSEKPYGLYFILEGVLRMDNIIALGHRVKFIPVLFTYFIHMWNTNIDQVMHLGMLVFFAFYVASLLSVKTWKHKDMSVRGKF